MLATRILSYCLICLIGFSSSAVSADKRPITLAEIETIFLEKNIDLIAAKFNIDATKGAAIQAGLWRNPNVTIEQSIVQFWQKKPTGTRLRHRGLACAGAYFCQA